MGDWAKCQCCSHDAVIFYGAPGLSAFLCGEHYRLALINVSEIYELLNKRSTSRMKRREAKLDKA